MKNNETYPIEIRFTNHTDEILVECFDEDSEMLISTFKEGSNLGHGYRLTVWEVKELTGFLSYHLKCQTEEQEEMICSKCGGEGWIYQLDGHVRKCDCPPDKKVVKEQDTTTENEIERLKKELAFQKEVAQTWFNRFRQTEEGKGEYYLSDMHKEEQSQSMADNTKEGFEWFCEYMNDKCEEQCDECKKLMPQSTTPVSEGKEENQTIDYLKVIISEGNLEGMNTCAYRIYKEIIEPLKKENEYQKDKIKAMQSEINNLVNVGADSFGNEMKLTKENAELKKEIKHLLSLLDLKK